MNDEEASSWASENEPQTVHAGYLNSLGMNKDKTFTSGPWVFAAGRLA